MLLGHHRAEHNSSAVAKMAAQCCLCHFLLVNNTDIHRVSRHFQAFVTFMLFNALFSTISENITIDHILMKTRSFCLHFSCREYGSNFNWSCRLQWNNAKIGSGSFNVTAFGTEGKPICNFLCVNNTNLHPMLHRFQDITDYWYNFRCQCLSLMQSLGVKT